MARQLSVIVYM